MIRVKTEKNKHIPWFAKAGASSSIVPISRFVGETVFALKGGGYLYTGGLCVRVLQVQMEATGRVPFGRSLSASLALWG
jgi:hypothetical protein